MTNEEWQTCDNPSRMRAAMRSWPDSWRRWVRFDLACLDRVCDLIEDPNYRACIQLAASRVEQHDFRLWYALSQNAEALRLSGSWRKNADPLQQAKDAALRAVLHLASHTLATSDMVCVAVGRRAGQPHLEGVVRAERRAHAALVRCVFQSTLSPVLFAPESRTDTTIAIARQMYESRDFSAMPILADALQDAGCDSDDILNHCRDASAPHVRGCWVVDLVLGKE